jgi:phage major head subunit gpT-like protein
MTGYRAIFKKALGDAFDEQPLYRDIATQFNSETDRESYNWLGANPTMSEWKDARKLKDLDAYDYTLINKHYEGTIAVKRDTYEDDKYGMIAPRVAGLANRAVRHWNQSVVSQLDDGATLLAFDGLPFFDDGDARSLGSSGAINNILSGAYSGSETEIRNALAAAYAAMVNFKDDKGVPMGLIPDTIVCSPTMLIPLRQALLPAVAGTTRPEAGIFSADRIFASPYIDDDADNWYVLCTKAIEVRPLIFQLRKQPEFISVEDPKQDHVFMYNEFLYGVDDRFATGYGDPRSAIKIVDQ